MLWIASLFCLADTRPVGGGGEIRAFYSRGENSFYYSIAAAGTMGGDKPKKDKKEEKAHKEDKDKKKDKKDKKDKDDKKDKKDKDGRKEKEQEKHQQDCDGDHGAAAR